jgi:hypothetical protein
MMTSPFAKMSFDVNETEHEQYNYPVFDLGKFDRSLHVLTTLKSRFFLEKTKSLKDIDRTPVLRGAKSSPGSVTTEMGKKRKTYPVRFS